jgi:hypothetical protein
MCDGWVVWAPGGLGVVCGAGFFLGRIALCRSLVGVSRYAGSLWNCAVGIISCVALCGFLVGVALCGFVGGVALCGFIGRGLLCVAWEGGRHCCRWALTAACRVWGGLAGCSRPFHAGGQRCMGSACYSVVGEPGCSRAREGAQLPVQCVCFARPSLPGCG